MPNLWTRLRTLQLSILTHINLSCHSSPSASATMMRCHLNLTVSTSHHSMWWHRWRLWCVERLCDGRLLAFYDQLIKDYPGSRVPGALMFLWEEMWARSEIQMADDRRLLPQLAEQQRDRRRYWWREPHAASNKDSCASVIYHPSRRLIHSDNYTGYNVQLSWNTVQTEI